jgi:hypothetical protein
MSEFQRLLDAWDRAAIVAALNSGVEFTDANGYVFIKIGHSHARSTPRGWLKKHVAKAELAFGGPLPEGSEVHHFDENKANNENSNLVICQDHTYHSILHQRTWTYRRGGDPDLHRFCCQCKERKTFDQFYRNRLASLGLSNICKECKRKYDQNYHQTDHGKEVRRAAERSRYWKGKQLSELRQT